MSGEFVKLMRKTSIQMCRKIDKITFKANPNPLEIWTFDSNYDRLDLKALENIDKASEDQSSLNHSSIFHKHAKTFMAVNNDETNITNFANQMMLTTNNEQEGDNMMNNLKIENEQLFFECKSIDEPSPLETHPVMSEYITKMQAGLTKNPYKDIFDNALNMFLDGKWKEAKKKFDDVKKNMPRDGPTEVLLK